MPPRPGALLRSSLALVLCLSGCGRVAEEVEQALDAGRDRTAHERYAAALEEAGLAGTALGRDWLDAGARALASPQPVPLPYREEGFLAASEPAAVGLRLSLRRGQVLTVQTTFDPVAPARVFVDLFRVPLAGEEDPLRPLVRVDSLADGMRYEPYRDGDYVLRLQPELLRGGRYRVVLTVDPVLAFPVEGLTSSSIGSYFGAPRDGGARDHHGVDIFAPRGTPVVAAADGRVTRVQETNRGGLVVWVRDEQRGQSHYYAHLDRQLVTPGAAVRIGDTLGLVGNTGNARTTPPHLHFGVYGRGPQDPDPYLRRLRGALPPLPDAAERLGRWARVGADAALRAGPEAGADAIERLPAHTPVHLVAGSGDWWRVRLPDGRVGWLSASATEPADDPIREAVADTAGAVRSEPLAAAPVVEPLPAGARVPVLGEFAGYLWVRAPGGRTGWLRGQ